MKIEKHPYFTKYILEVDDAWVNSAEGPYVTISVEEHGRGGDVIAQIEVKPSDIITLVEHLTELMKT